MAELIVCGTSGSPASLSVPTDAYAVARERCGSFTDARPLTPMNELLGASVSRPREEVAAMSLARNGLSKVTEVMSLWNKEPSVAGAQQHGARARTRRCASESVRWWSVGAGNSTRLLWPKLPPYGIVPSRSVCRKLALSVTASAGQDTRSPLRNVPPRAASRTHAPNWSKTGAIAARRGLHLRLQAHRRSSSTPVRYAVEQRLRRAAQQHRDLIPHEPALELARPYDVPT